MNPEDQVRSLSGDIGTTAEGNFFIPLDSSLSARRGAGSRIEDLFMNSEVGRRLLSAVDAFNALTGGPTMGNIVGHIRGLSAAGEVLPFRMAESKIAPIVEEGEQVLPFRAPATASQVHPGSDRVRRFVADTADRMWLRSMWQSGKLQNPFEDAPSFQAPLPDPPEPQLPLSQIFERLKAQGMSSEEINDSIRHLIRTGQGKVENQILTIPRRLPRQ